MKKIIALAGVYDSGKTTALLGLIAKLKSIGGQVLPNQSQVATVMGKDRREVLKICTQGTVYRVGVCTGGDLASTIQDNFSFFQGNRCDVGITACRAMASSSTVTAVIGETKRRFGLFPFFVAKMKHLSNDRQRAGQQAIDQLMDMVV